MPITEVPVSFDEPEAAPVAEFGFSQLDEYTGGW